MTEHTHDAGRSTAARYFEMAECGIIAPDDRVELLRGLVVAMAPQSPRHASTVSLVHQILLRRLGQNCLLRVQSSFPVSVDSVTEPDLALVPGRIEDYFDRHPTTADLIVEVAHSSLIQDRLTKAAIYARAGVPCYWIVNLRDRCVEVHREPDRRKGEYASVVQATGADTLAIDAWPGMTFEAVELLPPLELSVGE